MSRGFNQVILIGNVGSDPKYFEGREGGAGVCRTRMATSQSYKDKTTGERKDKTQWHNIVGFAGTGELMRDLLAKGRFVQVVGKLDYSHWEKDGENRTTAEVIVREFTLLDGQPSGQAASEEVPPEDGGPNLEQSGEFDESPGGSGGGSFGDLPF